MRWWRGEPPVTSRRYDTPTQTPLPPRTRPHLPHLVILTGPYGEGPRTCSSSTHSGGYPSYPRPVGREVGRGRPGGRALTDQPPQGAADSYAGTRAYKREEPAGEGSGGLKWWRGYLQSPQATNEPPRGYHPRGKKGVGLNLWLSPVPLTANREGKFHNRQKMPSHATAAQSGRRHP